MKFNAITWVLLNACSCQVEYNCLNETKCGVWCLLHSCLGCRIFHSIDAIVLSEIQCNINYLIDRQCVIGWNVFALLCVCLESFKVCSMPATNLYVCICKVTTQGNWLIMPSTFLMTSMTLTCCICFST
jgi:hypothetical protein